MPESKVIYFNQPYVTGNELTYIKKAIEFGDISGNGHFTKKCQQFFEQEYHFNKCLLTSSCTDALEMAALLCEVKPGDEVIMPSYTFVSTANAFVLRGAKIVFVDSRHDHPGMDESQIEKLITPRTKIIVAVHYAGVACDMDKIMTIAQKHQLLVVEDAAQAIDSFYKGKPLGGIGHFGAFSFHETKNITSGEGGMLIVSQDQHKKRAEIIWEKGTNRAAFYRGEIDKYGWVDVGSSFLPSELTAAFLWAQLENLKDIQKRRGDVWNTYQAGLMGLQEAGFVQLPKIHSYATNNYHIFFLVLKNPDERARLITHLKASNIDTVFHYQSLHKSSFYASEANGCELPNADHYTEALLRLPLQAGLSTADAQRVVDSIRVFWK